MPQVKRHPEKRRTPIVCGLCDLNETTAGCGVCGTCQETYRIGRETQRIRSTSAIRGYFLPTAVYSMNVEYKSKGALYRRVSFGELVEVLTGRVKETGYNMSKTDEMILAYHNNRPSYRNTFYKYFLTEEQAAVVKDFLSALDNRLIETEQYAYRSGSNMIARLASGELSIDDLNKLAIKREKE